jgi:hypothetical protein
MAVTERVLFEEPTYELQGSDQHWGLAADKVRVTGRFENDSQNNHWPSLYRKGAATHDIGSNWTAFESGVEMSPERINVQCHLSGGIWHGYKGPMLAGHNYWHFDPEDFFNLPLGYSTEPDLIGLGTTAIARVLPTNPISDLPVAVAEFLSEGFPGAPLGSTVAGHGSPRGISGDYLNYNFGIAPLLSDLAKFRKALYECEKLINGYARNAGKVIRRRYEFPEYNETTTIVHPAVTGFEKYLGGPCNSQVAGYLTPALDGWPGEMTETITRTKKTWFSGAFTYYLPPMDGSLRSKLLRQEAELRHLYGGLTVETAWNLLPYSWAADWVANVGDIIHNVSMFARDGLVMPFGYVMEKCELHNLREVRGMRFGRMDDPSASYTFPSVVSTTFYAKYLRRRKATPFGFGLNENGFTSRQKALVGALLLK